MGGCSRKRRGALWPPWVTSRGPCHERAVRRWPPLAAAFSPRTPSAQQSTHTVGCTENAGRGDGARTAAANDGGGRKGTAAGCGGARSQHLRDRSADGRVDVLVGDVLLQEIRLPLSDLPLGGRVLLDNQPNEQLLRQRDLSLRGRITSWRRKRGRGQQRRNSLRASAAVLAVPRAQLPHRAEIRAHGEPGDPQHARMGGRPPETRTRKLCPGLCHRRHCLQAQFL